MAIPQTSIQGVSVTVLNEIKDERGSVLHMMRADVPGFIGFGECYFSEVLPGAVKAWKKHLRQTQNIAVPAGRIKLVIFDPREKSVTRGTLNAIELGRPDAYARITIPPGLWYGFACIGETPAILANCADIPHDKMESEILAFSDSSIPFSWSNT
jgi:dTDP-4-dehydrorhamnose 3,5-epimerase